MHAARRPALRTHPGGRFFWNQGCATISGMVMRRSGSLISMRLQGAGWVGGGWEGGRVGGWAGRWVGAQGRDCLKAGREEQSKLPTR